MTTKNKIFRISHIGYVDQAASLKMISALEQVLTKLNHNFPAGEGVRTAKKYWNL